MYKMYMEEILESIALNLELRVIRLEWRIAWSDTRKRPVMVVL